MHLLPNLNSITDFSDALLFMDELMWFLEFVNYFGTTRFESSNQDSWLINKYYIMKHVASLNRKPELNLFQFACNLCKLCC